MAQTCLAPLCATGALSLIVAAWAASSPAPTSIQVSEPAPIKSVFVDRPDFGRDPFFPKSERRGKIVERTNTVVEPITFVGGLALKGISGTAEKRLAIINNKTFEVNEEGDIRINNTVIKVKCLEIRDNSVVVSVNGVSKELELGKKP